MKKNLFFTILAVIALIACKQQPLAIQKTSERGPIGDSAMIVSAHPLATEAGLEIMRQGGNAFDAAIAVHFALQVVFPEAGNIGGGGFAVIRNKNGESTTLDFREKAPKAASRDMYLDENGDVIPLKSRLGHLAAGVPGSVAGMWALYQEYGSLPWSDLLIPAIRLAYHGHLLTELAASNLNDAQEDFKKANKYGTWAIKEGGWAKGDSSVQRELAATLSFIQNQGRDGFYKGIVADQIVKEMQSGNGLISFEDLETYEVKWRQPVTGEYKGHRIISMPPPSSGGVALIQLLQGAERYDFGKTGHNTSATIHLMTELERRVYADRATYLGDPDYYEVPVAMLLDPEYNKKRYSDINQKRKTSSEDIKEGKVEIIESVQTTHYSIVDREGNAISVTTTLNGYFGCKVMVQGAGFFLNNEMDDFSAKPGIPNMFGLVGAEANAIAPGKRMLSSMTPTIVEKDNRLFMVTGTPGGATIITSVFQSILNVIDHGMTMQEAVNAPRLHSQWLPDIIVAEKGRLSEKTQSELEAMGHVIEFRSGLGKVDAILALPDSTFEGGADYNRGDDYAGGF
ncbi:MAG: gamma-glutamyltransferase [Cyclobacteriaceae bacterium]|nr:gamma-glutamyltransferase [Cyclobacteriaceae bacterium]